MKPGMFFERIREEIREGFSEGTLGEVSERSPGGISEGSLGKFSV